MPLTSKLCILIRSTHQTHWIIVCVYNIVFRRESYTGNFVEYFPTCSCFAHSMNIITIQAQLAYQY